MRVYLQALGDDVFSHIEHKYVAPTIEVPLTNTSGTRTEPKPRADYTNAEKSKSSNNAKALNAIFRALEDDETNRISSCVTAYDAWEALRLAYEGDEVVKEQQLQAFQTKFEDIRMSKNEPFDDFFLRLSTIINQAAGIGYVFDDLTVVRKIIRVLPRKRFGSKIDAITEATDIKKLTVSLLVSKIRAYEVAHENIQESKVKDKRFVVSNKVSMVVDSDDEELSVEKIDQEIARLSSQIKKMVQKRNLIASSSSSVSGKSKTSEVKSKTVIASGPKPKAKFDINEVDCYKCGGKGHLARDCATKSDPKKKQFANISFNWDDTYESGDDEDNSHIENHEVAHVARCLMARYDVDANDYEDSDDDITSVDWKSLYEIEASKNNDLGCTIMNLRTQIKEHVCDCENDDVLVLKSENEDLKKAMLVGIEEISILQSEIEDLRNNAKMSVDVDSSLVSNLKSKIDELNKCVCDGINDMNSLEMDFKRERDELNEKLSVLQAKFDVLTCLHENVLNELETTKKALVESNKIVALNPSTKKLEDMLSVGKASHDHRGLGYHECSTSTSAPSTTTFVRAKEPIVIDLSTKGKEPQDRTSRPKPNESIKIKSKSKNVPICWTCGVKGHAYYDCWNDCMYDDSFDCYMSNNVNVSMPSKSSNKRRNRKKKFENLAKVVEENKIEPSVVIAKSNFKSQTGFVKNKVKQVWIRKDVVQIIGKLSECDLSSISSLLHMFKKVGNNGDSENLVANVNKT